MYKRLIIFFLALVVVGQLSSVAYAYTPDDIAAEARAMQVEPQQISGWKILLNNITKIFGFEAFKTELSGSYAKEGTREGDQAEKDNCEAAGGSWVTGPGGFRGTCTPNTRSAGSGGQASNPNDPAGNVDPGYNDGNGGGGATGGRDLDGDGYPIRNDCDDRDDQVNPGRDEILGNGKDDDCNPNTPDVRAEAPDVVANVVTPVAIVAPAVATPTPKTVTNRPTADSIADGTFTAQKAQLTNTIPTLSASIVGESVRISWSFASGAAWPRDWIALFDINENVPQNAAAWGRATNIWKYVHNGKDERTVSAGSAGSIGLQIPSTSSSVRVVYYRDNGFSELAHIDLVVREVSVAAPIERATVSPAPIERSTQTPTVTPVSSQTPTLSTGVSAEAPLSPSAIPDCTLVQAKRAATRKLASDMSFFDRIRAVVSGSSASQLPEGECPRITAVAPPVTTRENQRVVLTGSGFTTRGNVVYFLQGDVEVAQVSGAVSFNRNTLTIAAPTLQPGIYTIRVLNSVGNMGNSMQINILHTVDGSVNSATSDTSPIVSSAPTMRPTVTPRPTRAPRPTPIPRVGCSPTTQTVSVGSPVTLTAFGGTGNYTWRAPKSAVLAGDGQTFTTVYEKKGRYYASVRDGSRSRSCRINVTQ